VTSVSNPEFPIQTERLSLRPFTPDDFDALYAIQSDPGVARYLYWDARDADEVRKALELRIVRTELTNPGDALSFAVEVRETGAVVGDVNLEWLSAEHQSGEVGFVFDPAHHGKGYATEAAVEMLRLGFDTYGMYRMIGRLDARNAASARVLEKLGMRKEAHFVENEYVKGEWQSELVYAMLASEWRTSE
jgi:RimJ/RimL family protein N-acetyltransferase